VWGSGCWKQDSAPGYGSEYEDYTNDSGSASEDKKLISSGKYVTNTERAYPLHIKRRLAQKSESLWHEGKMATIHQTFGMVFTPQMFHIVIKHTNDEAEWQNISETNSWPMWTWEGRTTVTQLLIIFLYLLSSMHFATIRVVEHFIIIIIKKKHVIKIYL
jgi:hypothetical protein